MISKKAQENKTLGLVIGLILLLALAFIVYVAFIKTPGRTVSQLFSSVGACKDPLVGDEGECDCFFDGRCPGGSEGKINTNCPIKCSDKTYVDDALDAQGLYDDRIKDIEKQTGKKLSSDLRDAVEAEFFGQCCVGAKRESSG